MAQNEIDVFVAKKRPVYGILLELSALYCCKLEADLEAQKLGTFFDSIIISHPLANGDSGHLKQTLLTLGLYRDLSPQCQHTRSSEICVDINEEQGTARDKNSIRYGYDDQS